VSDPDDPYLIADRTKNNAPISRAKPEAAFPFMPERLGAADIGPAREPFGQLANALLNVDGERREISPGIQPDNQFHADSKLQYDVNLVNSAKIGSGSLMTD
jgi:hypothetical protein